MLQTLKGNRFVLLVAALEWQNCKGGGLWFKKLEKHLPLIFREITWVFTLLVLITLFSPKQPQNIPSSDPRKTLAVELPSCWTYCLPCYSPLFCWAVNLAIKSGLSWLFNNILQLVTFAHDIGQAFCRESSCLFIAWERVAACTTLERGWYVIWKIHNMLYGLRKPKRQPKETLSPVFFPRAGTAFLTCSPVNPQVRAGAVVLKFMTKM